MGKSEKDGHTPLILQQRSTQKRSEMLVALVGLEHGFAVEVGGGSALIGLVKVGLEFVENALQALFLLAQLLQS